MREKGQGKGKGEACNLKGRDWRVKEGRRTEKGRRGESKGKRIEN